MRLLLLSLIFFVVGCSSLTKDETLTWSVQKLYREASTKLNKGSYSTARSYYNKILARYPFGRYAQQTGLDLIWLEYRAREYDKATAWANKFIRLYPRSTYTNYAKYMKGVIAYSRDVSVIDKMFPTNIAQSDQSMMRKAYEDFAELRVQNPESEYSKDAQMRMLFLRNISAKHEIYVATYYMRRGAFLAAVNRGQYVVSNFSRTTSVPLGLAIMVRSYQELHMPQLAADAKRVLDKNFPNAAAKNVDVNHILNGDIRTKKGFFASIGESLWAD